MISWIIFVAALILSIIWGVMFLRQIRSGLTTTALDDKFTWGLYVQGFFFLSALAGGILIFIAVASLFEIDSLRLLVEVCAAVSFSCLVAAGLLLGSDLGKPFRGMKILTGKNFASPLTWDFYILGICAVLNLVFLLGWISGHGPVARVWAVLCLLAALGYIMIHTIFFLSRVEAGFRSQPFLGLDTLSQSLWGAIALINLISLALGMEVPQLSSVLLILSVLVLMPLIGGYIASLGTESKEPKEKGFIYVDAGILVFLLLVQLLAGHSRALLSIVSGMILVAVFLEKYHLVRQYQVKPTLPLPYSRYEEVPEYRPTASEWILAAGSVGVCVLLSTVILYFKLS